MAAFLAIGWGAWRPHQDHHYASLKAIWIERDLTVRSLDKPLFGRCYQKIGWVTQVLPIHR
jgi:hypothetical protein